MRLKNLLPAPGWENGSDKRKKKNKRTKTKGVAAEFGDV
jgi:hypothetical protein